MLNLMPKSASGPPGLCDAVSIMPPSVLYLRITQDTAGVDIMPFWATITLATYYKQSPIFIILGVRHTQRHLYNKKSELMLMRSLQHFFAKCGMDCRRSRVFPIFDIMIHSGDIRDGSLKLSKTVSNFAHFGPQIFWLRAPKFWDLDYNTVPISVHVAVLRWSAEGARRSWGEIINK